MVDKREVINVLKRRSREVRKLKDKIKKIIKNKIRVNPERNTRILKRLLNVNFCEDYNFFL